jgi:NhaP-type Na+/H+ and K+/H+ antiporter
MGPRGLSSLLLVLLPVFAGMEGSQHLFEITALVVLLSVLLHGTGIAVYLRRTEGADAAVAEQPAPAAASAPTAEHKVPERITLGELGQLRATGEPIVLADVRTERSYRDDNIQAEGAVRLPPDDAVRLARAKRLSNHATLVLYCA